MLNWGSARMHGLVNKALQDFLVTTYGPEMWAIVRRDAGIDFDGFEPLLRYDTILTQRMLHAVSFRLDRPSEAFLEDVGTWLVAGQGPDRLRRLLRFGGQDFQEFLSSLDELPGRIKLAVPALEVPHLVLTLATPTRAELVVSWQEINLSPIVLGALRALADDYGALVLMDSQDADRKTTLIDVELLDNSFAEGRSFSLGGTAA